MVITRDSTSDTAPLLSSASVLVEQGGCWRRKKEGWVYNGFVFLCIFLAGDKEGEGQAEAIGNYRRPSL